MIEPPRKPPQTSTFTTSESKYFIGDPTESFLDCSLRTYTIIEPNKTPTEMQTTETESEMNHTLFVGDLSLFCDDGCLASLFAPFGSVANAQIRRGRRGDSLLYGFVEFANKDCAQTAMDTLDGKKFMGRTIRIRWADRNSESPDLKANLIQVHVTFTSPLSLPKVTEEVLNIIFSPYGEVADCVVRRCVCDQTSETQNGYGFVYFHSIEVARNAVDAIQKTTINGVFFDCDISHRSGHTNNATKGPAPQLLIQPGIYSPITRQNYRPNSIPENPKSSPTATSPFLKTYRSVQKLHGVYGPNSQKEGHVDTAPLIVGSDPNVIHQGGYSLVPMGTMVPKGVWYPSEVHHVSMGTPGHHHTTPAVGVPSHSAHFTVASDASRNAYIHYGPPSLQSVQGGPSHGISGETRHVPAQYVANYGAVSQGMHGVQYQYAMSVPPYPQHSLSMPSSPVTPEYVQYPGYGSPQMIPTHYTYSSVYHTGEVPVHGQMQVAYVPDHHAVDPNRPVGK